MIQHVAVMFGAFVHTVKDGGGGGDDGQPSAAASSERGR